MIKTEIRKLPKMTPIFWKVRTSSITNAHPGSWIPARPSDNFTIILTIYWNNGVFLLPKNLGHDYYLGGFRQINTPELFKKQFGFAFMDWMAERFILGQNIWIGSELGEL